MLDFHASGAFTARQDVAARRISFRRKIKQKYQNTRCRGGIWAVRASCKMWSEIWWVWNQKHGSRGWFKGGKNMGVCVGGDWGASCVTWKWTLQSRLQQATRVPTLTTPGRSRMAGYSLWEGELFPGSPWSRLVTRSLARVFLWSPQSRSSTGQGIRPQAPVPVAAVTCRDLALNCRLGLGIWTLPTIIEKDRCASGSPLWKYATVFFPIWKPLWVYGRQMWYQDDQKSVKFNVTKYLSVSIRILKNLATFSNWLQCIMLHSPLALDIMSSWHGESTHKWASKRSLQWLNKSNRFWVSLLKIRDVSLIFA